MASASQNSPLMPPSTEIRGLSNPLTGNDAQILSSADVGGKLLYYTATGKKLSALHKTDDDLYDPDWCKKTLLSSKSSKSEFWQNAIKKMVEKRENLAQRFQSLRDEYGDWISDFILADIDRILKSNAICAQCTGLPCSKDRDKNHQREIQLNADDHSWAFSYKPCKFFQAQTNQKSVDKLFKGSGIPAQYLGKTFDDYVVDADNQFAVQVAYKLIDAVDRGTFYYGKYGTGKTFLAALIAQAHLKKSRQVLFCKVPDMLRSIRATFSKDSKVKDVDILDRLYKFPILILDDVKASRQSKFAGETLFDIIDARYNAKLQTIMTSNNTLEEVAEAFDNPTDSDFGVDGSRIYDRCKQMCLPVKLSGKSRR